MSGGRQSGRHTGRQIHVLHHSSSLSPVLNEFPLSTQYVKTLVTVTKSKVSEFNYELTVTEGGILELDMEPMSNDMKKAVMSNGILPTEWLVCVTPAGEKRLIRTKLVRKVEETQARMYQLKKAAENLLQSLSTKSDKTAEIGKQIHELIGTSATLMKYFADQLVEAMKNSAEQKMKAYAAHALSHYMKENKDFVAYLDTKSEHFLKFADDAFSDPRCPPDIVEHICILLKDWSAYFESNRTELTQLLNKITADKKFKKNVLRIINKGGIFEGKEKREKLKDYVQTEGKNYFTNFNTEDKIQRLVGILLVKLKEADRVHRYDTMLNVFYLASFMFEASGHFKSNFTGHKDVRKIYSDNREQFDSGRYFEQWFPQPEPEPVRFRTAPPSQEPILVHEALATKAPPLPPKRNKWKEQEAPYENIQSVKNKATVAPKPTVKPRTVYQVKNQRKEVADPRSRLSLASQTVLSTMDQFLPSFQESQLQVLEDMGKSGFGWISLVKAESIGVPVVAKKLIHGNSLTENTLKEEANLLKCAFHPHIVRIVGKILSNCLPYQIIGILTEYMEGGNLYQAIHNPKDDYGEWQALTWMEHIASALSFLHSNGLIHRDIKSANMLLTSSTKPRNLKLCDFGMLKTVKENGMTGITSRPIGTPGYVAPEAVSSLLADSGYSTSVDIYSFAATIWEMVQRKMLQDPHNQVCFGEQAIGKEQTRPSLRNPRYAWMPALVTRMWQTDPALRPDITRVHSEIKSLQDLCGTDV